MARPIKDGVDYFPLDTDIFVNNDKVKRLRAEFGVKGMYLLIFLLCDIYGKKGYYINWCDSKCLLVSDGASCGCNPQLVREFVSACIRCGIFNKSMFDSFGILTSTGIQKRYIRMFNSREQIKMKKEYFLLDINNKDDVPQSTLRKLAFINQSSNLNEVNTTQNPNKTTSYPQKEIEKEKENQIEIKTNQIKKAVDKDLTKLSFIEVNDEIAQQWNEYLKMRVDINKPLGSYAQSLVMKKLESLSSGNTQTQKQILNQSLINSWADIYEIKTNSSKKDDMKNQTDSSYDIDEYMKRSIGLKYVKNKDRKD